MTGRGRIEGRWSRALWGCLSLCALLAAGEVLAIGLSKKPKPEDQPEIEAAAATGGAQGTAAVAPQRGNRAPSEDLFSGAAARARELVLEEERKHLRRLAWANRIQALGVEGERQKLMDIARKLRRAEEERHELARARLVREVTAIDGGGGGS